MTTATHTGVPPFGTTRAPGLLSFRGADAAKFLQGQLSNDMTALAAERLMLAGLHNPQGRVLALLQLAAPAPDFIIALLPAELAAATAATLARYVLRARVAISNESDPAALAAAAAQFPAVAQAMQPEAQAHRIAAGIPQVYAATSGVFVAQMLNLDCVGALSFSKGCYTGQEIIARAHYRGRMKRRMQRFVAATVSELAPGQAVTLSDGRTAQIVAAALNADGRTEFLAVTALPAGAPSGATASLDLLAVAPTEAPTTPTLRVACTSLPLPYELPG